MLKALLHAFLCFLFMSQSPRPSWCDSNALHLNWEGSQPSTELTLSLLHCAYVRMWCLKTGQQERQPLLAVAVTLTPLLFPVLWESLKLSTERADYHTQGEGAARTKITFWGTNRRHLNYSFDRVMDLAGWNGSRRRHLSWLHKTRQLFWLFSEERFHK